MAPPEKGAAAHGAVAKNGGEGEVSAVRRPGRPRVVHPDVAEFLLNFRRLRREKKKRATPRPAVVVVPGERARYDCAFEDEGEVGRRGGFAPGRLVWGKVRCHPWWPGQVFDPADASEQALEERRKHGATLVAFFWDKTFAWVDADELLPFHGDGGDFALLAGQSAHAMPALTASVDAALGEVARRVAAGSRAAAAATAPPWPEAGDRERRHPGGSARRDGRRGVHAWRAPRRGLRRVRLRAGGGAARRSRQARPRHRHGAAEGIRPVEGRRREEPPGVHVSPRHRGERHGATPQERKSNQEHDHWQCG